MQDNFDTKLLGSTRNTIIFNTAQGELTQTHIFISLKC